MEIDNRDKIILTNTLGLTALKELLIKKGVFTRAEWAEMFDQKSDQFEGMYKEYESVK